MALADEVRDRSAHNCEVLGRGEAAVRELLLVSEKRDEGEPMAGLLLDQAF